MKPQRLSMTHNLILGYGLHNKLEVYVSTDPPARPIGSL